MQAPGVHQRPRVPSSCTWAWVSLSSGHSFTVRQPQHPPAIISMHSYEQFKASEDQRVRGQRALAVLSKCMEWTCSGHVAVPGSLGRSNAAVLVL